MIAQNERRMPWETVFNFCMVVLVASAVLGMLWVLAIQRGGAWWTDYALIGMTVSLGGFIVSGVRKWLKSNAR